MRVPAQHKNNGNVLVVTTVSALIACSASYADTAQKDSDNPLETVVVSAQKREERLQDVPIAISVLGGPALDSSSAQGVMEAIQRVPGVGMLEGFQTGGPLLSIRGVNAPNNISTGANPIAYYLDTVPFAFVKSAITPDANAYDLERVEVLRGPQSTLYGASAQNGVVRVLTKEADLDSFEFKGRTSGSYTDGGGSNYRGDVAINAPIIEGKLAARAIVGYQSLSGWVDKPNDKNANDGEIRNFRLKVNSQITDDLSVSAFGWISRSEFDAPATGNDDSTHRSLIAEPVETEFNVAGLKAAYQFENFELTSATSYIDYQVDSELDTNLVTSGSNILTTNLDNRLFAQEVYLSSTNEGPWRWSVGGMYRDAEDQLFQLRHTRAGAPTGGYVQPQDLTFLSKSRAIFGELTRVLGDWELTAGVRYFEDEVGQRERSRFNSLTAPTLNSDSEFDATSPRVVVTWHVTDQMTTYASYAEGFRSGIDQTPQVLSSAPELPPTEPDNLTNYEIGAKGSLFGGSLTYDTAVYYMDWQDVQQVVNVIYQTASLPALVNGVSASGLGFDLGLVAQPTDSLTMDLSFSVNDLTQDAPVISRLSTTSSAVLYQKGDRLPASPKYTVSGGAAYDFPLGTAGYSAELSANASYVSERSLNFLVGGVATTLSGDPMTMVGARFTIKTPHRWEVSLFGDNLANEDGAALRHISLPEWTSRVRPRTVGLQFDYRM